MRHFTAFRSDGTIPGVFLSVASMNVGLKRCLCSLMLLLAGCGRGGSAGPGSSPNLPAPTPERPVSLNALVVPAPPPAGRAPTTEEARAALLRAFAGAQPGEADGVRQQAQEAGVEACIPRPQEAACKIRIGRQTQWLRFRWIEGSRQWAVDGLVPGPSS